MKLRFIHPDAKAGRDVTIPNLHDTPIRYGEEVDWPADMWRKALETGNWERLSADVKAETKPEAKREVQAEVLPIEKETS